MTNTAGLGPPFFISREEELKLRAAVQRLVPSPAVSPATCFDDFVGQMMIPTPIMELVRKSAGIRFSAWETEAVRASMLDENSILHHILRDKAEKDRSHPPYVRVSCTGRGDYDEVARERLRKAGRAVAEEHRGDYGSPVVLELWPGGHYSPIHSHGKTTGIIYSLTGQVDVMLYKTLDWNAEKLGLVTLTPGQCAWLNEDHFPVHKVYCPTPTGTYAATFHVYLNRDELPELAFSPEPDTRDLFDFVDEDPPHALKSFATYSDLSWSLLRCELARYASG